MLFNERAEDTYQRLVWDIKDIAHEKRIRQQELANAAGITYSHLNMLFNRTYKNSGIKAILALVDALGYEQVLRKREDA